MAAGIEPEVASEEQIGAASQATPAGPSSAANQLPESQQVLATLVGMGLIGTELFGTRPYITKPTPSRPHPLEHFHHGRIEPTAVSPRRDLVEDRRPVRSDGLGEAWSHLQEDACDHE